MRRRQCHFLHIQTHFYRFNGIYYREMFGKDGLAFLTMIINYLYCQFSANGCYDLQVNVPSRVTYIVVSRVHLGKELSLAIIQIWTTKQDNDNQKNVSVVGMPVNVNNRCCSIFSNKPLTLVPEVRTRICLTLNQVQSSVAKSSFILKNKYPIT